MMNKFKLSVLSLALIPTLAMNAGDNVKGGVDKANLDVSVAPGEDFYQYATGGWQKNNPLDPQYARFGTFDELAENNRAQIKDLILNLDKVKHEKGSVGQKVNDLFKLGMDSVRLNEEGATPIAADLAKIQWMKRADLLNTLVWMHKGISSAFFGIFVMSDLQNSDVNIVYASQAGLGLGDRDYYLENDENSTKIRNAYIDYIKTIMELAGYKNIRTKSLGSNNKQNVVLATIEGLSNLVTPEEVAKKRGKSIEEILG